MPQVRHIGIREEKFTPHHSWMTDEEYGKVLDNIVICCADVVPYDPNGKVLLGKRQQKPLLNWSIIGGRMQAGESPEEAARRNLQRELHFDSSGLNFWQIGVYSWTFATRAQEPQDRGCHLVSFVFSFCLPEQSSISFNTEYEQVRWFNPAEITVENLHHPYLVQVILDWRKEKERMS